MDTRLRRRVCRPRLRLRPDFWRRRRLKSFEGKVMDGNVDTHIFHELLECPNCTCIMTRGPVYKCNFGHTLCYDCYERLEGKKDDFGKIVKLCLDCKKGQYGISDELGSLAQKFGKMNLDEVLKPLSLLKDKMCAFDDKSVKEINEALEYMDEGKEYKDHYDLARAELTKGLIERNIFGKNDKGIGLREFGRLELDPFIAMFEAKNHSKEEATSKGIEMRKMWELQLNTLTHASDEDEEGDGDGDRDGDGETNLEHILVSFKEEMGDGVFEAILRAYKELDYHEDNILSHEIWDYKNEKQASFREGLELLLFHFDRDSAVRRNLEED
ncbi:hypothetical protein TorRG33x02_285660 [Trema orientale]|uniref:Factor of DNA methylation 1-5/IDN2 domain-containing protein n=1 Tax=Trema orientale TaxID=63057 RepID=A0A2P5CGR0_TREOI|nr:hypothetical protein TorRG33x02_285660 [Trema orientale]